MNNNRFFLYGYIGMIWFVFMGLILASDMPHKIVAIIGLTLTCIICALPPIVIEKLEKLFK